MGFERVLPSCHMYIKIWVMSLFIKLISSLFLRPQMRLSSACFILSLIIYESVHEQLFFFFLLWLCLFIKQSLKIRLKLGINKQIWMNFLLSQQPKFFINDLVHLQPYLSQELCNSINWVELNGFGFDLAKNRSN